MEPIRNNSNSNIPLWSTFAKWVATVNDKTVDFHFSLDSLNTLVKRIPGRKKTKLICKGRDLHIVLDSC